MEVKPRGMSYFNPSLDTQEPKKRFSAKKCNQKTNKKLSTENTVNKLSKFKYSLKISSMGSSNKIA